MTDTPTMPTLREIIVHRKEHGAGIGWNDTSCTVIDEACLNEDDINAIEAELLAPLKAEIARLQTKVAAADEDESEETERRIRTNQTERLQSLGWRDGSMIIPVIEAAHRFSLAEKGLERDEAWRYLRTKVNDYYWMHPEELPEGVTFAIDDDLDATKIEGTAAPRFGWPIHTNADGLPEISVVCEGCGAQYYWPLNDRGELELTPMQMECDCTGIDAPNTDEDTPSAVADAGEAGNSESTPPTDHEEIDRLKERIEPLEEGLAALRRDITQLEAFAAGSIEPTAKLRRDVDALESEQRLGWSGLITWQLHMEKRFAALESPRVPVVPVVTNAMIDAFWASWGSGALDTLTRGPLRDALSAALAVRDAGQ